MEEKMDSKHNVVNLARSKKQKRKRIHSTPKLIGLLTVACTLLFILMGPLFKITNIDVKGNVLFTDEEVLNMLHLDKRTNMFQFLLNNAGNDGSDLSPYIESMDVEIKLPKALIIEIEERQIIGYVPYSGAYLCIDKNGRVIETSYFLTQKVPIIIGIDFNAFKQGEILEVYDEQVYNNLVNLASFLVKYELIDKVIKVDMSNNENIRVYTTKLEVLLGQADELNNKVNTLSAILKEHKDLRGILDIRNLKNPIVLKKT